MAKDDVKTANDFIYLGHLQSEIFALNVDHGAISIELSKGD